MAPAVAVVKRAPERKHLAHLIKMVAYQAESALVQAVAPHYRRVQEEGRTLIQSALASTADLEVTQDRLCVTLAPLSSPRRATPMGRVPLAPTHPCPLEPCLALRHSCCPANAFGPTEPAGRVSSGGAFSRPAPLACHPGRLLPKPRRPQPPSPLSLGRDPKPRCNFQIRHTSAAD